LIYLGKARVARALAILCIRARAHMRTKQKGLLLGVAFVDVVALLIIFCLHAGTDKSRRVCIPIQYAAQAIQRQP